MNPLLKMYSCPYCRLFKARTFLTILNHLLIHENEPGFSIDCCVRGCRGSYHKVESLKKHIYCHYRYHLDLSQAIITTNDEWQCDVTVEDEFGEVVDDFPEKAV